MNSLLKKEMNGTGNKKTIQYLNQIQAKWLGNVSTSEKV